MSKMVCKLVVSSVETYENNENLMFHAVSGSKVQGGYPADGTDEDNTFATWTPTATLTMSITNPALRGKFKAGQEFYVNFTSADEPMPEMPKTLTES